MVDVAEVLAAALAAGDAILQWRARSEKGTGALQVRQKPRAGMAKSQRRQDAADCISDPGCLERMEQGHQLVVQVHARQYAAALTASAPTT